MINTNVHVPVINNALLEFKEAYNKHKIRTEGNKTPSQLFGTGRLPSDPRLDMEDPGPLHGVDPHAPAPHDIHLSIVDVPEVRIDLTYEQQQHVLQVLNHYQSRFKFKEDLYTHLRGVVHEMVDQNNDANQNQIQ